MEEKMKKKGFLFGLIVFMFVSVFSVSGGGTREASEGPWQPPSDMSFACGGSVGGGVDTFMRTMGQVFNASGIVEQSIGFQNFTGGGGQVCVRTIYETMVGRDNMLMAGTGSIMPVEVANNSPSRQTGLTPIARLMTETMAIAVGVKNTKVDTMEKFLSIMKSDPGSLNFGGTLPPSEDFLAMVSICNALGIDYRKCNYVTFDGSGEVLPALMGGHIDVSFSGIAEWSSAVEAGQVKVIAVAANERAGGLYKDTPTFKEKGVDFVWQNWRGLLGPREMPQEAIDYWKDAARKLSESKEWKDMCDKMLYEQGFMVDGFHDYLIAYEKQCEDALKTAGLIK
jgi:putative tricarboxylic transport membrane protein